MATVVYAIYEPVERSLTLAAAGHPYPLLARQGAQPEFFYGGRSPLLGTGAAPHREDGKLVLPPHSTLVLYTDGLIERRAERPLDEGLSMLAASVRADAADPEKTCEAILDELIGDAPPMDDVALLVMCTA